MIDHQQSLSALAGFPAPWFVCGGTALDIFLGKSVRPRADLDIGIFRENAELLYQHFNLANFVYMTPGQKHPIQWTGQRLELPIHEIHITRAGFAYEFLLNEKAEDQWLYRRNNAITRSLAHAVLLSSFGVPYLAPEIVLLYKSKHMREKDIVDYQAVRSSLSDEQSAWLLNALQVCYPEGHDWI